MKVYDQGSDFRVTVSANEVYAWSRRWPGANLRDRGYSFTFDKKNGDLVDMAPWPLRGEDEAAVSALADDAKEYGQRLLRGTPGMGGCTPC